MNKKGDLGLLIATTASSKWAELNWKLKVKCSRYLIIDMGVYLDVDFL